MEKHREQNKKHAQVSKSVPNQSTEAFPNPLVGSLLSAGLLVGAPEESCLSGSASSAIRTPFYRAMLARTFLGRSHNGSSAHTGRCAVTHLIFSFVARWFRRNSYYFLMNLNQSRILENSSLVRRLSVNSKNKKKMLTKSTKMVKLKNVELEK